VTADSRTFQAECLGPPPNIIPNFGQQQATMLKNFTIDSTFGASWTCSKKDSGVSVQTCWVNKIVDLSDGHCFWETRFIPPF
jgi:hypothetical protein